MTEPKQQKSGSGPLVPDRTSVPASSELDLREAVGTPIVHVTNWIDEITDPDTEVQAPGRTTHGATNNP